MDTQLSGIAKKLRAISRSDIRNWLKRGQLLTEARSLLGQDDAFQNWCRQEGIPRSTAYKAMAAHRDFGSVSTSGQFSKEAMAVLGQSTNAKEDAIDLSRRQRITKRIAKELVADYSDRKDEAETETKSIDDEQETTSRIFQVPGGFVIVKSKGAHTSGDLLSMLAHAAREVQKEMPTQRAA